MDFFKDKTALHKKVREVLESWPLYRELRYTEIEPYSQIPQVILLNCWNCRKEQWWDAEYSMGNYKSGFGTMKYTCRNCRRTETRFAFYWAAEEKSSVFFKYGQYPPQSNEPPAELAPHLDSVDLDFYRKALTSRSFSYGLGALAYLRRVIENQMNDMLDLLAEAARQAGYAQELLEDLEKVKGSRRFADKVDYAAHIIPLTLRPGGQNPIDRLHDVASEGLHSRSEEDCIEIFDRSKFVFEYVFRQLKVQRAEAEMFQEGLNRLLQKQKPKN
jgi:hypothetical protein